jgi:hypothetical protein
VRHHLIERARRRIERRELLDQPVAPLYGLRCTIV